MRTLLVLSLNFFTLTAMAATLDPRLMSQLVEKDAEFVPQVNVEILLKGSAGAKNAEAARLLQEIKDAGGLGYALQVMNLIVAQLPAQKNLILALQQDPAIAEITLALGGSEELEISTAALLLKPSYVYPNISNWWQHGYTGKKGVVGLLDSGVALEHPGLRKKMITVRKEPDSTYYNYVNGVRTPHGTGVACIIGGNLESRPGIAFGVKDYLVAMAGDVMSEGDDFHAQQLTYESLDWMLLRNASLPSVINYSFGHGNAAAVGTQEWSSMAKVVDHIVQDYNILWVKSAGNNGWIAPQQPSHDEYYVSTLTIPAENYNALTVANINAVIETGSGEYKTPDRSLHSARYSSSRGPTKIGRKKPDLAAPGHDTRTCAPDENRYAVAENPYFSPYSSSEAYDPSSETRLMGGTSAAAPHVTGAVLLAQEAGIREAMAIKALLINSADAWTDNNQPTPDDPKYPCVSDEPLCGHKQVLGSHWDRTYGWGYINMQTAFDERNNIVLSTLSKGNRTRIFHTVMAVGDKVTLVHERRVGYHHNDAEWELTPIYLEIYHAKTGKLLDADHSTIDSVHQVAYVPEHTFALTESKPIPVIIKVKLPDRVMIDGAAKEPFALVASGKVSL